MSYVSEDDMKDMENMIKDVTLLKPRLIATEMRQKEMSGRKAQPEQRQQERRKRAAARPARHGASALNVVRHVEGT